MAAADDMPQATILGLQDLFDALSGGHGAFVFGALPSAGPSGPGVSLSIWAANNPVRSLEPGAHELPRAAQSLAQIDLYLGTDAPMLAKAHDLGNAYRGKTPPLEVTAAGTPDIVAAAQRLNAAARGTLLSEAELAAFIDDLAARVEMLPHAPAV